MSELIDFGLCGKWQKETLVAQCMKGNGGNGVVCKDDELKKYFNSPHKILTSPLVVAYEGGDIAGYWVDYIIPPRHLFDKASSLLPSDRENNQVFRIEKFLGYFGKFKVELIQDSGGEEFLKDYASMVAYIREKIGYKFIHDWNKRWETSQLWG